MDWYDIDYDEIEELLSSGSLRQYLLPKLLIREMLCLESVSKGFQQLVAGTDTSQYWQGALRRTLPASHCLYHVPEGDPNTAALRQSSCIAGQKLSGYLGGAAEAQQAAHQYGALQHAIRVQEIAAV